MTDRKETPEENVDTTDALSIISKTTQPNQGFSLPTLPRFSTPAAKTDESDGVETREFPHVRETTLDEILGDPNTSGMNSDTSSLAHINHAEQFKPQPLNLDMPGISNLTTTEALPAIHHLAEQEHSLSQSHPHEPFSAFPEFPQSAMPDDDSISDTEHDVINPPAAAQGFTRVNDADTATAEFERTHATKPRRVEQSALDDPYFGLSEETIEHMKAAQSISEGFEPTAAQGEIDPDAPTAEIPVQAKK